MVIANKTQLKADTLRALPDLRFIAIAATGMNNVDLDVAAELGIGVKNVAGYSTSSVAEATINFALSLFKNTAYFDNYFKGGYGCHAAHHALHTSYVARKKYNF